MTRPDDAPRPLDDAEARDAVGYLRRLVALQAGTTVRLRGRGDVVGVFGRPPLGVVTVRSVRAEASRDGLDVTVPAAALAEAWAEGTALPAAAPPGAWPGPLPPADGWVDHGTVPAPEIAAARAYAAEAFRSGTAALGEAPVPGDLEALAEELWARDVVAVAGVGVPLRLLHAAGRLGFVPPGDAPSVRTAGPWVALAARHGTALVRRGPGLGPLLIG